MSSSSWNTTGLWAIPEGKQKVYALAAIINALCMQYSMAQLRSIKQGLGAISTANESNTDATIAGQWSYRRCQKLLSAELESMIILAR